MAFTFSFGSLTFTFGDNDDDTIVGGDGTDIIISKGGDDIIDAGGGDDIVISGSGDDTVDAGAGDDLVVAGSGNDTVYGGDGNDKLIGNSGDDHLDGGAGDDKIIGNADNDYLVGGAGNDVAFAGSGDDTYAYDIGTNMGYWDFAHGGSGYDTAALTVSQAQLDQLSVATGQTITTQTIVDFFNANNGNGHVNFAALGFDLLLRKFENITVTLLEPPEPALDLDSDDDSGATGADFIKTSDTIPVTAVDDSPLGGLAITAGGSTDFIGASVQIRDYDSANKQSLSVTTTGTAIAASYDETLGLLTLSGNDTLANYEQVLKTLTYDAEVIAFSENFDDLNFDSDWAINLSTINPLTGEKIPPVLLTNRWQISDSTGWEPGLEQPDGPSGALFMNNSADAFSGPLYKLDTTAHTFAESPSVSTLELENLTLSFDYLAETPSLSNDNSIDVVYSVDGGTTWITLADDINDGTAGTWTTFSSALPTSAENLTDFRFGFQWDNDPTLSLSSEISIAIDNILISADDARPNTLIYEEDFDPFGTPSFTLNVASINPLTGEKETPILVNKWLIEESDSWDSGFIHPEGPSAALYVARLFGGNPTYEETGTARVFAESSPISTFAGTDMTLSFDYIALGDGADDAVDVYYSVDGGTIWTLLADNINTLSAGTWTTFSSALPAVTEGLDDFRFGFQWDNDAIGALGADRLAVAIDNIKITGKPTATIPGAILDANVTDDGGTTSNTATATLIFDSDGDGIVDAEDALPNNPNVAAILVAKLQQINGEVLDSDVEDFFPLIPEGTSLDELTDNGFIAEAVTQAATLKTLADILPPGSGSATVAEDNLIVRAFFDAEGRLVRYDDNWDYGTNGTLDFTGTADGLDITLDPITGEATEVVVTYDLASTDEIDTFTLEYTDGNLTHKFLNDNFSGDYFQTDFTYTDGNLTTEIFEHLQSGAAFDFTRTTTTDYDLLDNPIGQTITFDDGRDGSIDRTIETTITKTSTTVGDTTTETLTITYDEDYQGIDGLGNLIDTVDFNLLAFTDDVNIKGRIDTITNTFINDFLVSTNKVIDTTGSTDPSPIVESQLTLFEVVGSVDLVDPIPALLWDARVTNDAFTIFDF